MYKSKEIIANVISSALNNEISGEEILEKIEMPKDNKNGDFAYPCFNLAKLLKDSPVNIANKLGQSVNLQGDLKKVEAVNGYLNFYLDNNEVVINTITKIITQKENYGSVNIGNGETVVVDYSSPNIAKPFHLGHLRNTVLGHAICNLYKELGYSIYSINYLGDWGRQFGLLIEGYNRFKEEYDFENDAIQSLADIYVRINKLTKEDDTIMDKARQNFKELEDGSKEYLKLWEYFREISIKEYNNVYKLLGCEFDSYNGEAFYNDKMEEVIDTLDKKGVLIDSQGAKVVEVGEDMPPCIILKSNGSTIYATRDLASLLYRVRNYDFSKAIYITGYEQCLHFKQVFEVSKHLIDEKYTKGLVHIPYGMIRLKSGKMSSRDGTIVYVKEIFEEAINKANKILVEKNSDLENLEQTSKQIGIGALVFNYLKNSKIKDMIFDIDESLRFDGETGPYVQYTYVRTKSILNKANFDFDQIGNYIQNISLLKTECETNLVKQLDKFEDVINKAALNYEPAILARYLIDVSSDFSRFYNECQVISDDISLTNARCILVYATSIVIKKGLHILGIECPEKM